MCMYTEADGAYVEVLQDSFRMEVVECTQDQWMENALVGREEEPEPLEKLEKIENSTFGLKFSRSDGHGEQHTCLQMDMSRYTLIAVKRSSA